MSGEKLIPASQDTKPTGEVDSFSREVALAAGIDNFQVRYGAQDKDADWDRFIVAPKEKTRL